MSLTLRNNNVMIYIIAALFSIVLSYDGSLRATVVNPDGICYLQSAASIGTLGLRDAMHLCGQAQWPAYSILIFDLVKLTNMDYITAAHCLDGIFSLISVLTFIYIVKLLGGTKRVLVLAAATILLAHDFDSVREYVIRDHGFWAFYLISVAALIQYFRLRRAKDVLLWVVALIIATLFRVEGVIFIILVPLIALFDSGHRLRSYLQLNAVTILLGLLALLFIFGYHGTVQIDRLMEIENQFMHGASALFQSFHERAAALGQHVLSSYSARDAGLVLFLLLVVWYGVSVVASLSLIYTLLFVYAWCKKSLNLDQPGRLVLAAYVCVNVLITAAFLVDYMFLSKRYLIALSLLLMLWVPFALESLIAQHSQRKWLLPVVVLVLVISSLGGMFDFGYSKAYIRDAGRWLADNVPAGESIYSNDYQVMFYSTRFGNRIFSQAGAFADMSLLANAKWKQYAYVALRVDLHELKTSAVIQEIQSKINPVHVFANKRGDEVVIYKISN
jgi:hypothetical protein